MTPEEIMLATGQQSFEQKAYIPRLTINYDAEDDEGNTLQRGAFKVSNEGDTLFAKTVTFTPILSRYQYSVYDSKENNFPLVSTQFASWGEPLLDTVGNEYRAAKYKKSVIGADPSLDGQLKCTRLLYGVVELHSPVDRKGTKKDNFITPCVFPAKGVNFSPVSEVLDGLSKQKKLMHNVPLGFSTTREKNGGTTYFQVAIQVPETETPFDHEGLELTDLISSFLEIVTNDNKQITAKYEQVKSKQANANDQFARDFMLESNGAKVVNAKPDMVGGLPSDPLDDFINN